MLHKILTLSSIFTLALVAYGCQTTEEPAGSSWGLQGEPPPQQETQQQPQQQQPQQQQQQPQRPPQPPTAP